MSPGEISAQSKACDEMPPISQRRGGGGRRIKCPEDISDSYTGKTMPKMPSPRNIVITRTSVLLLWRLENVKTLEDSPVWEEVGNTRDECDGGGREICCEDVDGISIVLVLWNRTKADDDCGKINNKRGMSPQPHCHLTLLRDQPREDDIQLEQGRQGCQLRR